MQDFHLPEQTFQKSIEDCSLYLKFVNPYAIRNDKLQFKRLFSPQQKYSS